MRVWTQVQGTKGCKTEEGVARRLERWAQKDKLFTVRKVRPPPPPPPPPLTFLLADCFAVSVKATNPVVDAYSAFATPNAPMPTEAEPSPLTGWLRSRGITTLAVVGPPAPPLPSRLLLTCRSVGLATDYCVISSARSALSEGFKVLWIPEASRATGGPEAAKRAEEEIERLGARVVGEEEVRGLLG